MFSSLTPAAPRDFFAPATRGSMMLVFHRAWTIAIRSAEPTEVECFSWDEVLKMEAC